MKTELALDEPCDAMRCPNLLTSFTLTQQQMPFDSDITLADNRLDGRPELLLACPAPEDQLCWVLTHKGQRKKEKKNSQGASGSWQEAAKTRAGNQESAVRTPGGPPLQPGRYPVLTTTTFLPRNIRYLPTCTYLRIPRQALPYRLLSISCGNFYAKAEPMGSQN